MKNGIPENVTEAEEMLKSIASNEQSFKNLCGIFKCRFALCGNLEEAFKYTVNYYSTLLMKLMERKII
jgi:hypothetical protein